ncbi:hypothetical protein, partial [Paenibacillus sp. Y412MC10]|uniref:hypothetical protein n=1 Tax=Geobacillus sp. (strain Y412MC10) TaxID=481743 RepID=UPI001642A983
MVKSFGEGRVKGMRGMKVRWKEEFGEVGGVLKELWEEMMEKEGMEERYVEAGGDEWWVKSNMGRVSEVLEGMNWVEEVGQGFMRELRGMLGGD